MPRAIWIADSFKNPEPVLAKELVRVKWVGILVLRVDASFYITACGKELTF